MTIQEFKKKFSEIDYVKNNFLFNYNQDGLSYYAFITFKGNTIKINYIKVSLTPEHGSRDIEQQQINDVDLYICFYKKTGKHSIRFVYNKPFVFLKEFEKLMRSIHEFVRELNYENNN